MFFILGQVPYYPAYKPTPIAYFGYLSLLTEIKYYLLENDLLENISTNIKAKTPLLSKDYLFGIICHGIHRSGEVLKAGKLRNQQPPDLIYIYKLLNRPP